MRRVILALLALLVLRRGGASGSSPCRRTCPPSALPTYSPNLANGEVMFHAGGCASCHATPDQEDKTRLGGGAALKSPFGTFYRAQHLARSEATASAAGARRDFVTAMLQGHVARRRALLPGVSLPVVPAHEARRRARPVRLSQDAAGGAGQGRAITTCRSRSTSAACSAAGNSCSSTASRSRPIRRSPAQWNRGAYLVNGPGPLRRMPQPAQCARRHRRGAALRRRPDPGGRGLGAEHHPGGARATTPRRTSSTCSRPARRRTATPSAAAWRR